MRPSSGGQFRGGKPKGRGGRKGAPARRVESVVPWIQELDDVARQGLRPDVGLSRILKREGLEAGQRRSLVLSMAAWFRWKGLLGEEATPASSLGLARRLEEKAATAGVPAALRLLESQLQHPVDPQLPAWIARDLPRPKEARELARAFLRPPSLWLRSGDERALRRALGALAQGLEAHPGLPGTLRLVCDEDLYATEAFLRGLFVLQDPATQAIGLVCQAKPGQRWLDLCAGAGGKTLQLAVQMQGKGLVEALDINTRRLDELRRRARRQQVFNLRVRQWNGRQLPSMLPVDGVLVDAPCSGSGTLRRNPDLWGNAAPDVEALLATQEFLLERAVGVLKAGGRLVYATCSVLARENEGQVEGLLQRHPELELESFTHPWTGSACPGILGLTPLQGDHDGTFMARLRKKTG